MSDGQHPLASLTLTHVHYNPRDPLSYLAAWLALVPQALCVVYVSVIWASREVEVLLMFAGQMGCEALNFGLKRWIREERPKQMFGKGYGMPSSHSQFVAFFSLYLALFLVRRQVLSPSAAHYYAVIERVIVSILAGVAAAAVSISRIYLNYHTPRQVLAGSVAGFVFAVLWFGVTAYLRHFGWIDWVLDWELARMARLRDLLVSEDLVEAGWQQWNRRRERKRQKEADASRKLT
ncbi:Phosphatidic acid phosphatase type 2/haloperoxidase [Elaphomyces granulatus]|jgi:dolichyldiphosphatase